MTEKPVSIQRLVRDATSQLSTVSDSALLDAQVLLCHVLDKPRSYLLTWPEKELDWDDITRFEQLLARRVSGEPVAYIIGSKEFWSLPFKVSPATLIPRPDTEVLVEQVLANHPQTQLSLLDLGTGTGAIAIALASEMSDWHIEAVDFSHDAVSLARQNAKTLLTTDIDIYQSDWFSAVKPDAKFNIIVSNPPYIDVSDHHLEQGDVRFEPKSALVAADTGLADIRHIATTAKQFLVTGGCIYIEHGFEQAKAVSGIFSGLGYCNVHTFVDYSGRDRITCAQWCEK